MKRINITKSGIPLVDEKWGGFYKGGTYLLVGARDTGRTLAGLQYAVEAAKQNEKCLYFVSMKPKDLLIHAASINIDLEYYLNENLITLVRVAPPMDEGDQYLVEYLEDVLTVMEQYKPAKIIFDDLTPLIGFKNVQLLQNTFRQITEQIEDQGVTSLYIIGEPVTDASKKIIDSLAINSTGILYFQRVEDKPEVSGKMIITPNIGHTEGQLSSFYNIDPIKGLVLMHEAYAQFVAENGKRDDKKYGLIKEVEQIPSSCNEYDFSKFKEIINLQISLYKSAGISFSVLVMELDPEAENKGILSFSEFESSVRGSLDNSDKVCFYQNRALLLVTREDIRLISKLVLKIKENLSDEKVEQISKNISVYSIKISDAFNNADDLFNLLFKDELQYKKELGFK